MGLTIAILILAAVAVILLFLVLSALKEKNSGFNEEFAAFVKESRETYTMAQRELRDELHRNMEEVRRELDRQLAANRESIAASTKQFQESHTANMKQFQDAFTLSARQLQESVAGNMKMLQEGLEKSTKLMSDVLYERMSKIEQMQGERLQQLDKSQKESLARLDNTQRESLERLDKTQNELIRKSDEKLEHIRVTVEEKLDKTLSERLGKSFETVGKQLNEVQQGLGEMKTLANDVGGLKKVLGNVKMRGGLGEVQLAMLLENILAPDQYSANVITKKGSREVVEFAIKLPGSSDEIKNIWLPIDAKFPKDVYEKLQDAYDIGDVAAIESAQKELDAAIKLNAKDISSKYIDAPYTTNFAIMFLPFEGIYAEVVRKADLLEYLQRTYNVIVTGPTTLAAILNSLQIGFKTLAIQKRSSEVWETLGAVKTEFEKFGGILEKAKDKIQGGLNDMDTLVGTRTRAIKRKLRSVESLEAAQSQQLLGLDDSALQIDGEEE